MISMYYLPKRNSLTTYSSKLSKSIN